MYVLLALFSLVVVLLACNTYAAIRRCRGGGSNSRHIRLEENSKITAGMPNDSEHMIDGQRARGSSTSATHGAVSVAIDADTFAIEDDSN